VSVLEAIGVRAGYGRGEDVLRGVDVRVAPGVTVVVGPNGAGKTTLMRAMLGVIPVRAGTITLDGADLRRLGPRARATRVAAISQRPMVSAAFSVLRVVELGRFARGPSDGAVRRALEAVGLWDRRDRLFGELSAGQQQRVSLARALAQLEGVDGGVLIADEPVSSMDPAHALAALVAVRGFAREGGAALVSMQDLTMARRFADRCVGLGADGRVAIAGPVDEALTESSLASLFGAAFERLSGRGGEAFVAWGGSGAYREGHGR
jgi:iron complex transport system ATP-binding protein